MRNSSADHWIGRNAIFVQMGDTLDRGRNELDVILMLERLREEAGQVGGQVVTLLGNHDAMAVSGIFDSAPNLTGFLPNRFTFGEHVDADHPRHVDYTRSSVSIDIY